MSIAANVQTRKKSLSKSVQFSKNTHPFPFVSGAYATDPKNTAYKMIRQKTRQP